MLRPFVGPDMPTPPGRRGRANRRRGAASLASMSAGFTVSAVMAIGAVHVAGAAFGLTVVPVHARIWFALPLCAALCLIDIAALRSRSLCKMTMRRQTPKNLIFRYGDRVGPLIWGLDTGLAVTTFRVAGATWAVLVLSLLNLVPWWLGLVYAAGFCIPVTVATIGPRWRPEGPDGTPVEPQWISRALVRWRRLVQGLCLTVLTGQLIALGLAVA
jgi:hypothetical protein